MTGSKIGRAASRSPAANFRSKVKRLFTSILKSSFFVSIVSLVVPLFLTVTRQGNHKGHEGDESESRLAASKPKVGPP